jgi:hypothetical protein
MGRFHAIFFSTRNVFLIVKLQIFLTITNFWRFISAGLKKKHIVRLPLKNIFEGLGLWCFNDTFNNISVILWRSVLLVGETGVPINNKPNLFFHGRQYRATTCLSRYGHRNPTRASVCTSFTLIKFNQKKNHKSYGSTNLVEIRIPKKFSVCFFILG